MTFDMTVHISEIMLLLAAVWGLFRTGVGLRDSVRDLTTAVKMLTTELRDHEDRIRVLESRR